MKLKNPNCDETQKLTNSNCNGTQNSNSDKKK